MLRRSPFPALALAALAAVLSLPGSTAAATRQPLTDNSSSQDRGAAGVPVPDRLLSSIPPSLQRAAQSSTWQRYPLAGGFSVAASSTYYQTQQIQAVIDSLAGLVHGAEINGLSVYVATPQEISNNCGAGLMACYSPSTDRLVISGLDEPIGGFPREFVIAHEYGHHIANHRANSPWPALDQGTQRWATYERVCEGVGQGHLFPGNEGAHYWENPGEAFAQSYATLNFPALDLPWLYSPLLVPDSGSLAAIGADVTEPLRRRRIGWRGSFPRRPRRSAARTVATPFDGVIRVRLRARRGTNFNLVAFDSQGHRIGGRRTRQGSKEQLRIPVCGTDAVRIAVRRRKGAGPFAVSATRP